MVVFEWPASSYLWVVQVTKDECASTTIPIQFNEELEILT